MTSEEKIRWQWNKRMPSVYKSYFGHVLGARHYHCGTKTVAVRENIAVRVDGSPQNETKVKVALI